VKEENKIIIFSSKIIILSKNNVNFFKNQTKQEEVYLLEMAIMKCFQDFWLAEVTWLNAL